MAAGVRKGECQTWGWNGHEHTSNPWRTDRSSGGSSAGAEAAVGPGMKPVATGGDSAGSLRIPAAFGVTGLKGTYGRVPRPAGRPLAQLTVADVIGAELADTVLATSIAGGPDPRDPATLPQWPGRPLRGCSSPSVSPPTWAMPGPTPRVAGLVAGRLQALAAAGMIRARLRSGSLTRRRGDCR